MYWIFFILVFLPATILLPVKIFGKNKIKRKQKYIIVFNHQSGFDGVILSLKLKRHIHYVSKKELWKGKKKSFLFDNILQCIKVDRQKGFTLSNMRDINKYLAKNQSIGIAPEGTRIENGLSEDSQIKNGACLLSIKTKTPILPCFIEKKQKIFKPNTVLIGVPIEFNDFYDKKITKEVLNCAGKILLDSLNGLRHAIEQKNNEKVIVKKLNKNK